MNIEQARFNMIEQQIRPWNVLDQDVLDLLHVVKREQFVPEAYQNLAFADVEIPLPGGDTMFNPKIEARILQELNLKKHEKVLEIGAGSGYMAALMAHRLRHGQAVRDQRQAAGRRAGRVALHVLIGRAMQHITAPELAAWLADPARPRPLLLDVRENWEFETCHIAGSTQIPMHLVPIRAGELGDEQEIVCICHHGARSMQVAAFLERNGFENVTNLTGGIHAWAMQVDPAMPKY